MEIIIYGLLVIMALIFVTRFYNIKSRINDLENSLENHIDNSVKVVQDYNTGKYELKANCVGIPVCFINRWRDYKEDENRYFLNGTEPKADKIILGFDDEGEETMTYIKNNVECDVKGKIK